MALDRETVGTRYATALFDLATEEKTLDSIYEEVVALQQVFTTNDTLGEVLSGAILTSDQKKPLLAALKKDASKTVANLLQMVFDYGRMAEMPNILADYIQLYDQKRGLVHAKVTSAVPLSADQKDALAQQFATRIGANNVELDNVVDDSIIGGVIVKSNDLIIDGSIRTRLMHVRQLLLG
ncbi:ATP synthase F1 subunit delta [Loigolactobacillus backii]|uniref:ATP synthase subunit delta n=1 Tax=Loigolactobacillus backii TaxID=375175 RepID=A0A192H4S0_9LACO|nr:ATP synthase F1 subunit delta [Loigolactobacillus backii]ANK59874.1 ATP synthase F0F1 subunit delta [Loigolactobacillus backii]ANK63212.1 F0F1 ATP synthase subunit delta [Loigolactobacillus backii]ANK64807.1 F0F1 ATP synthase subunit delta [Loigolactobacillus backii]ANK66745.1 F0F1 ATP synthase subunit delta [Loigolactobacillus backii]ANK69782.1 F0F1 ATP synthase subunit delta [Loigolactobacillus backii]